MADGGNLAQVRTHKELQLQTLNTSPQRVVGHKGLQDFIHQQPLHIVAPTEG